MADIIAVLDANVLFPESLRDTLLRAGEAGLYQMYWTDEILEEVHRNLVKSGFVTKAQGAYLINAITTHLSDSFIKADYQSLIPAMLNESKDRHVLAAAVAIRADVIVTSNLRDFSQIVLQPYSIVALHPDQFLMELLDEYEEELIAIIVAQAQAKKRPTQTVDELLIRLERAGPLPQFTRAART